MPFFLARPCVLIFDYPIEIFKFKLTEVAFPQDLKNTQFLKRAYSSDETKINCEKFVLIKVLLCIERVIHSYLIFKKQFKGVN